jgi:hypothetical protein
MSLKNYPHMLFYRKKYPEISRRKLTICRLRFRQGMAIIDKAEETLESACGKWGMYRKTSGRSQVHLFMRVSNNSPPLL